MTGLTIGINNSIFELPLAKLIQYANLYSMRYNLTWKQLIRDYNIRNVRYFSYNGVNCIAVTHNQVVYVIFCDTKLKIHDIVLHFFRISKKFFKFQTKNLIASSRYVNKYYCIKQALDSYLVTIHENTPIIFVGHGLGGALAQLAFIDAHFFHALPHIYCSTFGSYRPFKTIPLYLRIQTNANVRNYCLNGDDTDKFPYNYHLLGANISLNDKNLSLPKKFLHALKSIFVASRHPIASYASYYNNQ